MSVTEKKSLAYDYLALIQQYQQDLAVINRSIAEDSNQKTVTVPETNDETKKETEEVND